MTYRKKQNTMVKKTTQCPECGRDIPTDLKEVEKLKEEKKKLKIKLNEMLRKSEKNYKRINEEVEKLHEKLKSILSSGETPYEKKLSLFNL